MHTTLVEFLVGVGLPDGAAAALAFLGLALVVLLLSWAADRLSGGLLLRAVRRLASRTATQWDDLLVKNRVFSRISHFAPALVIYSFASAFGPAQPWIERLALVYLIVATMGVVNGLLDAASDIYATREISRERPIPRSYVQVAKIANYILGGIFAVSTLLERSPWGILTGIGALSAVLLLVFRDSILGFVASLQLAGNDMVKPGDWVEMPAYGADGDVIEVGLNTVKIRNWDKTISTIPTHALITNSFKNWQGMTDSGGRRIKRAVHLDVTSVKFCDDEMLERFGRYEMLRDYLAERRAEVEKYNVERSVDTSSVVNGRRLTNLGTFRAYIVEYLRRHPKIHDDMTFLVRQLAPTERGVPIEIYVFSNDQDWVRYEGIQSDIFDHILAVAPEFDLRVYQSPSSADLAAAVGLINPATSR